MTRIGRNDPCPCGSGKKYKHCCLKRDLDSIDASQLPQTPSSGPQATPSEPAGQPAYPALGLDTDDFAPAADDDLWGVFDDEMAEVLDLPAMQQERLLWDMERLLTSGLIPAGEDPDKVLNDWLDRDAVPEVPLSTPLEQAQALMYDAWAWEEDPDEQIRLATEALEISRDCADAYVLLGMLRDDDQEEQLEYFAEAVSAGKRALSPYIDLDDPPDLSGSVWAYPYLRACVNYALAQMEQMNDDEARWYLEHLLEIDPADTQGARFTLIGQYLHLGDRKAARQLIRKYRNDYSSAWSYATALIAYQEQGDTQPAGRRLREAVIENPHLAAYLTHVNLLLYGEPQPWATDYEQKLDGYFNARNQIVAWAETPGALEWLIHWLEAHAHILPAEVRSLVEPDPSP